MNYIIKCHQKSLCFVSLVTSGLGEPYVPRSISCFNQQVYDEAQGIITCHNNHYDQDYDDDISKEHDDAWGMIRFNQSEIVKSLLCQILHSLSFYRLSQKIISPSVIGHITTFLILILMIIILIMNYIDHRPPHRHQKRPTCIVILKSWGQFRQPRQ